MYASALVMQSAHEQHVMYSLYMSCTACTEYSVLLSQAPHVVAVVCRGLIPKSLREGPESAAHHCQHWPDDPIRGSGPFKPPAPTGIQARRRGPSPAVVHDGAALLKEPVVGRAVDEQHILHVALQAGEVQQ